MIPIRKLKVGAYTYPVRFLKTLSLPNVAGLHYEGGHIEVSSALSPIDQVDTLIHEAFHAILYAQGRPSGGPREELYVRALATGLVQLIRDNPKLAGVLASIPLLP